MLLRVFSHLHGDKIVLLLSGYDKGASPSGKRQQKEIARARGHLTAWREAPKRAAAKTRRGRSEPARGRHSMGQTPYCLRER